LKAAASRGPIASPRVDARALAAHHLGDECRRQLLVGVAADGELDAIELEGIGRPTLRDVPPFSDTQAR
jgi:hypothetical protein